MDRDEAIRRAEMFLSYLREEKQYQFRAADDPYTWIDLHPYQGQETYLVRFLDPFYQFRPKPEPMECWVWAIGNVAHNAVTNCTDHPTANPIGYMSDGRWVRMREVTEE